MRACAFIGVASVVVLAACALGGAGADEGAIPQGPPRAMAGDAIGPVTVLGSGRNLGVGWRFMVYESVDGLCTQLEMGSGAGGGCGSPHEPGDSAFGGVSHGSSSGAPNTVDGLVDKGVAEVVLTLEDGEELGTTLMPLGPAGLGLEGNAFVGFVPAGAAAVSVSAIDTDGDVIETMELFTGP